MGLVDLITEMLGWVRDAMDELDDDRKAIVIADLMRVTKKVQVMMEDGKVSPFDELADAPGTS